MRVSTRHGILAGLVLALAGSGSALAADAQAFGSRLKEVSAAHSIPIDFASAESSGNDVVLKGFKVGRGPDSSVVGDVTFQNVTGSDAEGWKVERVPLADVDSTDKGKRLQVAGMVVEGLQIAGKTEPSKLPGEAPYYFDSAAINSLTVTEADKPLVTLGATSFTNSVDTEGEIDSQMTIGDFALDFAAAGSEDGAKTMQDIGYSRLTGDGSMQMSWNPKTGETSVSPFRLTLEDAGELSLSYELGGYTPAFAKSLAAVRDQMANDPNAAQSSGMAIIGLMSQLSIGSFNLGFTDASLTGKLLDYYAKKNGQTREQIVQSLSQAAPQLLQSLNNPAFQTEVATAVSTYLKDPQSIDISIEPAQPIPATQVLGAAMGAPQTLPTVLQLHVKANDQSTDLPDEGEADAPATAPAQPQ